MGHSVQDCSKRTLVYMGIFFIETVKKARALKSFPNLSPTKLVTRLPNFPDRRIMYESFLLKNIDTNKKVNFWNFLIFLKGGWGKG